MTKMATKFSTEVNSVYAIIQSGSEEILDDMEIKDACIVGQIAYTGYLVGFLINDLRFDVDPPKAVLMGADEINFPLKFTVVLDY